jgi:gas vesicle protein
MAEGHERDEHEGGGSFMMGLLTGTVLGAGLGVLLAPKSGREIRHDIGEQASSIGRAAGEQFRRASETAGGYIGKRREAAGSGAETRSAIDVAAPGATEPSDATASGGDRPAAAGGSTYTGAERP